VAVRAMTVQPLSYSNGNSFIGKAKTMFTTWQQLRNQELKDYGRKFVVDTRPLPTRPDDVAPAAWGVR